MIAKLARAGTRLDQLHHQKRAFLLIDWLIDFDVDEAPIPSRRLYGIPDVAKTQFGIALAPVFPMPPWQGRS